MMAFLGSVFWAIKATEILPTSPTHHLLDARDNRAIRHLVGCIAMLEVPKALTSVDEVT